MRSIVLAAAVLLALPAVATHASADSSTATTFVVNSTDDPGDGICFNTCTLREAIVAANGNPGRDRIEVDHFLIRSTIDLASPLAGGGELPAVTDPVDFQVCATVDGTHAGLGGRGLVVLADGVTISCTTLQRFSGAGVELAGASGTQVMNVVIQENGGAGVHLTGNGSNNVIGDGSPVYQDAGKKNQITNNLGPGVLVEGGTGNIIRTNLTLGNGGLPIDLGGDGADANDPQDLDGGANNKQNAPTVKVAVREDRTLSVVGTLDGAPNTQYAIDLYKNTGCPRAEDAGWRGFTTAQTDAQGHAFIGLSYVTRGDEPEIVRGDGVTATATNLTTGDTSELSPCDIVREGDVSLAAAGGGDKVVVGETTTYDMTIRNAGPDPTRGAWFVMLALGEYERSAEIVSIRFDHGSCDAPGDSGVECRFGPLSPGQEVTGQAVVRPLIPGRIFVQADIDSDTLDYSIDDHRFEHSFDAVCTINGTASPDLLVGTPGDDVICAAGGNDEVRGGGGDDILIGGGGDDDLSGGSGRDSASYSTTPSTRGVVANLADGVASGAGRDRLRDIEGLIGSRGPDVLRGDRAGNLLRGFGGNDRLVGKAGSDRFYSRNRIRDAIDGGRGRDVAQADRRKDALRSVTAIR